MDMPQSLTPIREGIVALPPREAGAVLVARFREHELLRDAGAIAFRLFLSIVPLTLFGIAMLGFLNLEDVWRQDVAPDFHREVSSAAFNLIDDTVNKVLTQKQGFWLTLGAVIAVWEVSGAVRMAMKSLNAIYGTEERRTLGRELLVSVALAGAIIVLVLGAVLTVKLGPLAIEALFGDSAVAAVVGFVVRWASAVVLLALAVGLVVRAGPDKARPIGWVTFGTTLVIVGWVGMSLLFGLYLTELADYGSIFSSLATVFVALEYVFLSSVIFLGGLVLDAAARQRSRRG